MRTIVLLNLAKADLIGIWHYTASTWDIPQADRYVGAIHATLGKVANGTDKPSDAEAIRPGLKRVRCGSHFAFVIYQEDSIHVVRVLHERMNFDDHL